MNEAETRAEHIDPALKAAGWGGAMAQRWVAAAMVETEKHFKKVHAM